MKRHARRIDYKRTPNMVNPSVWLFLISIFLMIFGFGFKINAIGMIGTFIFGVYVVYWVVWIIIEMSEI